MNTTELFNDHEELAQIAVYAEHNELTVDYVIQEFVIDNKLVTVDEV